MYYIRFKTSFFVQLVTCFIIQTKLETSFSSLLIKDMTQLFLLRLAKKLMLKNLF